MEENHIIYNISEIKVALRDRLNILENVELDGYCCIPSKIEKGRVIASFGDFCVAARMIKDGNSVPKCIRVWHDYSPQMVERSTMISNELKDVSLPYFVGYHNYVELLKLSNGRKASGVIMDWVDKPTLELFFAKNYSNPQLIEIAKNNFLQMCKDLKRMGMSHGDLSLGNILVGEKGDIILVDYDSVYVPSMKDNYFQTTPGNVNFQHPDRKKGMKACSYADFFSELVLFLYFRTYFLKPDLCKNVQNKLLFVSTDLTSSAAFIASDGYKMLSNMGDREINLVLKEISRALDLPLSRCNFICDVLENINKETSAIRLLAGYCGTCGHHFKNQTDLYCPDCGKKREIL